ncbi:exocyst complex component SEC3A isoform X2 [Senna tora]|uniref:Exocyst complex component SEC3A isoform X2 n=1 Tax=Senna tora TaxID=362788 RepID=A0A834WLU5_9FABA|nr:exocyst complex component SEC3A isoform X2 [Senna tora]
MFLHGKQNMGKNYCSQVVRQSLLLLKLYEEEFRYVFHGYHSNFEYNFGNHGFARNKMWVIEDNPPSLPNVDSNVGGAEAFSERLKKELQPLEAANVHAILESEPMLDEAQSFNPPTASFLHQDDLDLNSSRVQQRCIRPSNARLFLQMSLKLWTSSRNFVPFLASQR